VETGSVLIFVPYEQMTGAGSPITVR
jgi:hypothetical protein